MSTHSTHRVAMAALLSLSLLFAGCGSDDDDGGRPTPVPTATATSVPPTATATVVPPTATATLVLPTPTNTVVPATATATASPTATTPPENFRDLSTAQPAAFEANGSVGQVWIRGATAGETLELVGPDSLVMASGVADEQGSLILRDIPVSTGYTVVSGHPGQLFASDTLAVSDPFTPPDDSFYESQVLQPGYGYLQTRDGTLLAINVVLPGPPEGGPYPTVVEYSGYDPANPDAPQPSTRIAGILGYAAVGVNMRGTGCSGGAFQFFEWLQSTDGYDAVEIIARQPWVQHGQVGLVGLSYPGISQLFVAQLNPPSLAAIAPLAVIADVGRGTLYPGGILNNGFATDWAAERHRDSQPGGQPWAQKRIDEGDQTCIANQTLRGQNPDIFQMIEDNRFYVPEIADPLTPALFADFISAPVFLAGSWQDEQVGGYVATMLGNFGSARSKHFTLLNGNHSEPLIPAIFGRWSEFLSFYVRREVPAFPLTATLALRVLAGEIFGAPNLTIEPDRFTGMSYEDALAAFEAEPAVRILFDNGAGSSQPGAPVPGFEASYDDWPVESTSPEEFYLADGGVLLFDDPAATEGIDAFLYDDSKAQRTTYTGPGDGIWKALPPWDWQPLEDDKAVAYATAPLTEDTVLIGSASVDLWIRADKEDVDLQVTLSEIRPDGKETYVQNGWLRASHRKLDPFQSDDLRPVQTHLESDAEPLPAGEFVEARIEIFPFAHAFRTGSRIRIAISSPGGDRPLWKFRALEEEATVEIAHGEAHPSRVVLPVVRDVDVPTALPPCPSLRGQPCRDYVEIDNTIGE